jgi:hypothetical protein
LADGVVRYVVGRLTKRALKVIDSIVKDSILATGMWGWVFFFFKFLNTDAKRYLDCEVTYENLSGGAKTFGKQNFVSLMRSYEIRIL